MDGPHPSHVTRFSDASTYDEICVNCGAHDHTGGGWGRLALPCPQPPIPKTGPVCLRCGRVMSAREAREQGACNDCIES
jgi:DNA-directed RNA polymerase subunit RPC12/RpoP